jgi:hypothetical protein
VSRLDSAAIRARIVKILGPNVGPDVSRDVIDWALPAYAIDVARNDDGRVVAGQFRKTLRGRVKIRRGGGPRKLTARQSLAVRVAWILRGAGVETSKSHSNKDKSKPRGGLKFEHVLRVVFEAVNESRPADMFDVINAALNEAANTAPLRLLDPNRPD